MKLEKKTWVAIGVFATVGVTGLAIMYRKEIASLLTGGRWQRMNAVRVAKREYKKWNPDSGKIKEHDQRTLKELDNYWKSVNRSYSSMKSEPWSAAFISYVMKEAGLGDRFKYSPLHSTYIIDSINNRLKNKGFVKGFKPEEIELKEGYLVCYSRAGANATYSTQGAYTAHCDIVTDIDKLKLQAVSIGGNVSDSVSKTTIPIDKSGKIDLSKSSRPYIAVLKY